MKPKILNKKFNIQRKDLRRREKNAMIYEYIHMDERMYDW